MRSTGFRRIAAERLLLFLLCSSLYRWVCDQSWKSRYARYTRRKQSKIKMTSSISIDNHSLNKSTIETYVTVPGHSETFQFMKKIHTAWLMCKMLLVWLSELATALLPSVKWYAAGNRRAPTLKLSSEEWTWVAAVKMLLGKLMPIRRGINLTRVKFLLWKPHPSRKEAEPKNQN